MIMTSTDSGTLVKIISANFGYEKKTLSGGCFFSIPLSFFFFYRESRERERVIEECIEREHDIYEGQVQEFKKWTVFGQKTLLGGCFCAIFFN